MSTKEKLLAVAVSTILLTTATSVFPQTWTPTSAPITNWSAIAMSADGSRLLAAVQIGLIYVSTNGGSNWTGTSAPVTNWSFIASSADGGRLAALANAGGPGGGAGCWIFTSGDGGATWLQCPLSDSMYSSLAMSADGSKLAALSPTYNYHIGRVTYSTNFGASWSNLPGPLRGFTVTCAADGGHLFVGSLVAPQAGEVHSSTDFGITWNPTGMYSEYWSLTCSADGHILLANALWRGQLDVSTNYGASLTVANLPNSARGWSSACSADGATVVTAGLHVDGPVGVPLFYVSTNSGNTWINGEPPSTNTFTVGIAVSADGRRTAAIVNGGGIYTWQTTPTPVLSITPSNSSILISWIVPSIPFVLQENASLTTANWTDVTTTAILNFTNLHHEVSVLLPSANRFYRLKSL